MNDSFDKIREYNIIWDFARNYNFTPKKTYPMDEVYKNIITGFEIKTFDFKILNSFFNYLKTENPFFDEFKFITELLLEDISYRQISKDNLVIAELREKYAKEKYNKYRYHDPVNLKEQMERAYYGRILNHPIIEGAAFRSIYDAVFKINTKDTNILIDELNKVFKTFFKFDRSEEDENLFSEMVEENEAKDFKKDDKDIQYKDEYIDEQFAIGAAEFTGNIYLEEKTEDQDKNLMFLNNKKDSYHSSNQFIEDFYGKSIISETKLNKLQKEVSIGIHKDKKLYFTRGEYTDNPNAKYYKKNRDEQYKLNKEYIEKNLAINNRSINELSQSIKNTIANYEDYEKTYKNYGVIDSSKAWRVDILHDYDVFQTIENDDINKFKVDLLLDSSASQIKRQQMIANEAYIIEKSMEEVNIPIRIMSFSTLKDHTVFNIYKDFDDKYNDTKIYEYYASGSNRDGLALKALHQIIKTENDDSKHIIIVLSDGKPNDERSNINTTKISEKEQYKDENAINDTAMEVRNIKEDNISILGVFTGEENDVEKAKLIYNNDFCRITSLENFSKIVSIFIRNQIMQ